MLRENGSPRQNNLLPRADGEGILVAMLDPNLIPLLRCPATKQPLRLATEDEKRARGIPLEEQAFISQDGTRLYRTLMDLPILLSANDVAVTG